MEDVGSQADWVGNALTAIGMIVSVGILLFQLGKQHRSSLKLQRSNAREALKLQVYQSLLTKAQAFAEAESDASSYANSIVWEFRSASWAESAGLPRAISRLRAPELAKRHFAASSALVELIAEIENWEIAFPAAEVFRLAFSSASYDIENAFHPLFQEAVRLLPAELADGTLFSPPPASPDQIGKLEALVSNYTARRGDLRMYTHDLGVEAQNLLLQKLFKRRTAVRKPIDPGIKVITARNSEALIQYFKTETASGRAWAEADESVRKSLLAEGTQPDV